MNNKPFWNWMMNLGPVKWFCNLNISKKAMNISIVNKIFNYEMITYIFYGVATTLLNWVIYWGACKAFSISMENPLPKDAFLSFIANAIAFVIALIFAFVTNKLIVFKSKDISVSTVVREFISFTIARLLTFGLESLIIVVAPLINFNLMIAKIFAGILVVILNYVFSKIFIFKKRNKE